MNGNHGKSIRTEKKKSFPKAVTEEGSTLNEMVGCHKFNCWERQ